MNARRVVFLGAAGPAVASLIILIACRPPPPPPEPQKAVISDNLVPAGTYIEGEYRLELDILEAEWHLLGDDKPAGQVLAFAERGHAPSIPGPLIRVALGTRMHITISNPLDTAIVIRGLSGRRDGLDPAMRIPPRRTRVAEFEADTPGTYYYWGSFDGRPIDRRFYDDTQLAGAFIVEGPGEPREDRILMIGIWGRHGEDNPYGGRELLVINGRPWPHTERLEYAMGDSIRWRLINTSHSVHPMHLHGFYFRVDRRGNLAHDTIYRPEERRREVTERIPPGGTRTLTWSPNRPGGWIFHCHIGVHIAQNPSLDAPHIESEQFDRRYRDGVLHHDADNHVVEGMGGLMMAMYVRPSEDWAPDESRRRELRLFVTSAEVSTGLSHVQFSYALQEGELEPSPDSLRLPGPTLVLRKGEPTTIKVFNRSDEPTQVHWHGLEIESYFDGVVGVGGDPTRLTPSIAVGDSFEVRITPPRAGSFMYHTHMNDLRQQGSGLYGPFVVLDEDEQWDPETDRVFNFGESPLREDQIPVMNGLNPPPPTTFEIGTTYRLRFMQLTLNRPSTRIRLVRDSLPVRWIPIAKDGHDLAARWRRPVVADQMVAVGETYDYAYTPNVLGELRVELITEGGTVLVDQVVNVVGPAN